MKRKSHKVIALLVCLLMIFSLSITAFAADIPYVNHHHTNTSSVGPYWFSITTDQSISQFTVETQDFKSGSAVSVEVWNNSKTTRLCNWTVYVYGNDKIENQPLMNIYPAGTYQIKYSVQPAASGWIGVWLY